MTVTSGSCRTSGSARLPAWTSEFPTTWSPTSPSSTTSSSGRSSRSRSENDNIRFFDHRREDARTDWDRGGLPNEEWEALLARGPPAGRRGRPLPLRRSPRSTAARTARTSAWPIIREHFATKGLGLHNDLQNEHSIVGNNVGLLLMLEHGTDEQKAEWVDDLAARPARLRLRHHRARSTAPTPRTWRRPPSATATTGSSTARRRGTPGIHKAQYDLIFARTSGEAGDGRGITAFLTPTDAPGLQGRGVPVDVQHADRPRPHLAHERARAELGDLRR